MGITISVYSNFVSFIRSLFHIFSSKKSCRKLELIACRELKLFVYPAILILVLFRDEAELNPMELPQERETEATERHRKLFDASKEHWQGENLSIEQRMRIRSNQN